MSDDGEKWFKRRGEMLKVVVFDSGWGGELVADYIESEVPILEVIRVIDWRHAPYGGRGREEICGLVDEALRPYVGKVEAIVLASNLVTLVAEGFLRERYPGQRFVGCGRDLVGMLRRMRVKQVMMLTTQALRRVGEYGVAVGRVRAMGVEVLEVACDDWITKIDDGKMTEGEVRKRMGPEIEEGCQIVVMCSTHLMDLKGVIERVFDWRALVVDFRRQVVRDLCRALGLRGGDGRRLK